MRVVKAIVKEARMRICEIGESVETIYIGGGTPSMLPRKALEVLAQGVGDLLDLSCVKEWTFEANPEDVTPELLASLRQAGVNRVSIGIQSFEDKVLRFIGRRHDSAKALSVLKMLSDGGWNYSADLIFGLPHQSVDVFGRDLDRLLEFSPPHFSCYLLSIEPSTRFGRLLEAGKISEASESEVSQMYDRLITTAARYGYDHYEISNYALKGYRSLHNSSYWESVPYLGLGPAAYSFDGHNRLYNPHSVEGYLAAIESGTPASIVEPETLLDRFNDYVFTSLRTADGYSLSKAGAIDKNLAAKATESLLLDKRLIARDNDRIAIPEQSFLVSDAIIRDHLLED